MVMIGNKAEFIPSVVCGNTIAITGIEQYLLKSGTISGIDTQKNNSIRPMKYSVSPVFKVAVRPSSSADLPKLIEGLGKLVKADPLVLWIAEETGENIVAGCGELHIEICMHELRKYTGKEIIVSEPIVSYRETVTTAMLEPELVKTSNKQNRFYGTVEPLDEKLIDLIESGQVSAKNDPKLRSKQLVEDFSWSKDDASRIWVFGPEDTGPNVLIDQLKGVQNVNEVKDSICSAFQWASKEGVLIGENMRGIKFNIVDALIHADSAHRRGAQVVPSSRRLFQGLELAARPTLQEPVLMCEITAPNEVIGGIYQTLNQRRGAIIDESQLEGSLSIVKAYLPVATSYGFAETLRGNTQGKAFPQCFFDHW